MIEQLNRLTQYLYTNVIARNYLANILKKKKKKNSSTQRLVLFLEIKSRVTASLTLHLLKIHKFRKSHKFRSNQKQLDKSGIEPETFYLQSKRDNPYTTCPKDCFKCTLNVFVRFSGFLTKILFFFFFDILQSEQCRGVYSI